MGATVITNKAASAFATASGKIIYALFERTYEKNCHPHYDNWSCMALGDYAYVLKRVFMHAGVCEGGMLQSRTGWIKPENFISAWQRKLAAPTSLPNVNISLYASTSFTAPLEIKHAERDKEIFTRVGRENTFMAIQNGEHVKVSLHDDIDLLLTLYGSNGVYAPWHILDYQDSGSLPDRSLGFTPARGPVATPAIPTYRLHEDNVMTLGNQPKIAWDYSQVADFINLVAYPAELQCTGSSQQLICAFRDQCKQAPKLPSGTRFEVTRHSSSSSEYNASTADYLARQLGVVKETETSPDIFQFTIDDAIAKKAAYYLSSLASSQMKITFPDAEKLAA